MAPPVLRLLWVPTILTCLLACSSLPANKTHPLTLGNWGVSGKIGITTPQESMAGFIDWQQQDTQFEVYVSGPLSVGNTLIKGNSQKISITKNGKTISGLHPQQLIYEELGWQFPVQNLPYWIKGQVAPFSQAVTQKNDDGRLTHIQQDQWQVAYTRYNAYYGQPSRIKISQGQWKFIIVIKNWSFDS